MPGGWLSSLKWSDFLLPVSGSMLAPFKVEWNTPGDSGLSVVLADVLTCDSLPDADPLNVTDAGSSDPITVAQGTRMDDIAFPAKVPVILDGKLSATLPVSD